MSTAPTIKAVRGLASTTPAFRKKLWECAGRLKCNPDYLATIISFESAGSFSPSKKNAAGSGATGLIQFMPATAVRLGTTTAALALMTAEKQLDYVEKYFAPWAGKLQTLEDLYMAVLWPAGVGKPASYVLFEEGTKAYEQNKGFDRDGIGEVTKAQVSATIRAVYSAATGAIPIGVAGAGVAGFVLAALGVGAWMLLRGRA